MTFSRSLFLFSKCECLREAKFKFLRDETQVLFFFLGGDNLELYLQREKKEKKIFTIFLWI